MRIGGRPLVSPYGETSERAGQQDSDGDIHGGPHRIDEAMPEHLAPEGTHPLGDAMRNPGGRTPCCPAPTSDSALENAATNDSR